MATKKEQEKEASMVEAETELMAEEGVEQMVTGAEEVEVAREIAG